MAVRVFIVEDHPIVLEGYVLLLHTVSDLELVGTAETGEEALDRVAETAPDVVAVDLQLPGMSGLEVVRHLRERGAKPSILVVSAHEEALYAERALEAGADGYLTKSEAARRLPDAIQTLGAGGSYVAESARAAT